MTDILDEKSHWKERKQVNKQQRQRAQSCGDIKSDSNQNCKINVSSPTVLNNRINIPSALRMSPSSAVNTDVFSPSHSKITVTTGIGASIISSQNCSQNSDKPQLVTENSNLSADTGVFTQSPSGVQDQNSIQTMPRPHSIVKVYCKILQSGILTKSESNFVNTVFHRYSESNGYCSESGNQSIKQQMQSETVETPWQQMTNQELPQLETDEVILPETVDIDKTQLEGPSVIHSSAQFSQGTVSNHGDQTIVDSESPHDDHPDSRPEPDQTIVTNGKEYRNYDCDTQSDSSICSWSEFDPNNIPDDCIFQGLQGEIFENWAQNCKLLCQNNNKLFMQKLPYFLQGTPWEEYRSFCRHNQGNHKKFFDQLKRIYSNPGAQNAHYASVLENLVQGNTPLYTFLTEFEVAFHDLNPERQGEDDHMFRMFCPKLNQESRSKVGVIVATFEEFNWEKFAKRIQWNTYCETIVNPFIPQVPSKAQNSPKNHQEYSIYSAPNSGQKSVPFFPSNSTKNRTKPVKRKWYFDRRTRRQFKQPIPDAPYVCNKCNITGHWRYLCPGSSKPVENKPVAYELHSLLPVNVTTVATWKDKPSVTQDAQTPIVVTTEKDPKIIVSDETKRTIKVVWEHACAGDPVTTQDLVAKLKLLSKSDIYMVISYCLGGSLGNATRYIGMQAMAYFPDVYDKDICAVEKVRILRMAQNNAKENDRERKMLPARVNPFTNSVVLPLDSKWLFQ